MVIKYGELGLPWEEPPYTGKRLREIEKMDGAAPVSITHAPAKQPPKPRKGQLSVSKITKAGSAD